MASALAKRGAELESDPDDPDAGPSSAKTPKIGQPLAQPKPPFAELTERVLGCITRLKWDETIKDKKPWYVVKLDVEGTEFVGEAGSKKEAKHNMAEKVLQILPPKTSTKRTCRGGDTLEKRNSAAARGPIAKTPFVWLQERVKGVNDKLLYAETVHEDGWQWFTCTLELGGKTYSGEGRNKKIAKTAMAEAVLPDLPNVPAELVLKAEEKYPPSLTDQATARLFERCQPITMDKFHHKFVVTTLTEIEARSEERRHECTLTVREQSFTAASISKNGAKGLCAIEALKVAFFEDVSKFIAPPSVEFRGRLLPYAAGELCARRGIRLNFETVPLPQTTDDAKHKNIKLVCRLSNHGYEFTSAVHPSDKLARDDIARQILRKVLDVSYEEIEIIDKNSVIA